MADSKTQYMNIIGKITWAKLFKPDEFRGASNWTLNLYPQDDGEWEKIKKAGLQGKPKDDDGSMSGVEGKYITLRRPTQKTMGKKLIMFAPPHIWDASGKPIMKYVDAAGKLVGSFEGDPKFKPVGEQILIGNGSLVDVRLSYYPTQMGIGNRLEQVKVLDLIEYIAPEEVSQEEIESEGGEEAPW